MFVVMLPPHCVPHCTFMPRDRSCLPQVLHEKLLMTVGLQWGWVLCQQVGSDVTSIPGSGTGRWRGGKWLLAVSDFNGELIIHYMSWNCQLSCSLSQKEESNPTVVRYQHQNTPDLNDLQMELLKPKGMLELPKLNKKRKCWGHLTLQRAFSWPISSTNASRGNGFQIH